MKINNGKLEISSVRYTDAGAYQCFVSNKFGRQYSTATLTITGTIMIYYRKKFYTLIEFINHSFCKILNNSK